MATTNKPLQIFKPGRHTAMSGASLAFSESDLAASAAAYDPAVFQAPIVVGHPKTDDPAYGWVSALAFADGALEASPDQVDPAFAEIVEAGRYKKISAAFYAPEAPNNPVPGVYYLRHVGFLGAAAPAVKGLRSPEFADAEEGVVEFSEWDDATVAHLFRSIREWLIGRFGQDEADKVIPTYEVRGLEISAIEKSAESDAAVSAPLFSENPIDQPTAKEASTVTPEEAAALEAENAQLKEQLRQNRVAVVHAGHVAFAEGLITAGKVLPAEQVVVVTTLDHFASQEAPVEFAEGDDEDAPKKPLLDGLKSLLERLPKAVEFSELATHERASEGVALNDAESIRKAAVEFQEAEAKAGRDVTYVLAVQHVVSQRKGV
jgi:hypothetical protein